MLRFNIIERAVQIPGCQPFCHCRILIQVVSAVSCGSSGDLSLEIPDKLEHLCHERHDFFRGILPVKQHIAAGAASHGSEIDRPAAEHRMIAKEGRPEVFDRVELRRVHDRLLIRRRHAKIKGRDHLIPVMIYAGNVNSRLQFQVIDRKARYFLHIIPHAVASA